jgi:hypothetical protein
MCVFSWGQHVESSTTQLSGAPADHRISFRIVGNQGWEFSVGVKSRLHSSTGVVSVFLLVSSSFTFVDSGQALWSHNAFSPVIWYTLSTKAMREKAGPAGGRWLGDLGFAPSSEVSSIEHDTKQVRRNEGQLSGSYPNDAND